MGKDNIIRFFMNGYKRLELLDGFEVSRFYIGLRNVLVQLAFMRGERSESWGAQYCGACFGKGF